MISLSQQHVSVPQDVMVREVGGEAFLLKIESQTYFGLDAMGTRMFEVLRGSASLEDAALRLQDEYEVDPEKLRGDLRAFVEQLQAHGLVDIT